MTGKELPPRSLSAWWGGSECVFVWERGGGKCIGIFFCSIGFLDRGLSFLKGWEMEAPQCCCASGCVFCQPVGGDGDSRSLGPHHG